MLDLTAVLMGPYCTQLMGDMGAEVIKVERSDGDSTRYLGPSRHSGMAGVFLNVNRNKRSIVLDLKKPAGREVLLKLAQTCDVFVHSMRPQAMTRLGLTYEEINAVNESIIYCGTYGFGQNGPYSHKPAYDDMIQGVSGFAALQGRVAGEPQYIASVMADKVTGMAALYAILAALVHRERTGEGQAVDVSMFETMASFLLVEHIYGMAFEPPIGTAVYPRPTSPYRKPYPTTDGYICLLAYTDKQWARFFELAGRPDLIHDERFLDLPERTKHIDELYKLVSEILETRTTAEWLEALEKADIPSVPMNTPEELFRDPHLEKVGFFSLAEHPTEGTIRHTGIPVVLSKTPGRISRFAPRLGEHSIEILLEAGYSRDEIEGLIRDMVVVDGK